MEAYIRTQLDMAARMAECGLMLRLDTIWKHMTSEERKQKPRGQLEKHVETVLFETWGLDMEVNTDNCVTVWLDEEGHTDHSLCVPVCCST